MKIHTNKAYISLISVIIVGSIATTIAITLIMLGVTYTKNTLTIQQSNQASSFADACAEQALMQIRNSTPYQGTGNLVFGDADTCEYTVTSLGGQNRKITSTGNAQSSTRKVQILISTINPKIIIDSWQEVADFN